MIQKILPYAAFVFAIACSGGKDVGTLDTETPTPDGDADTDTDTDTDTAETGNTNPGSGG